MLIKEIIKIKSLCNGKMSKKSSYIDQLLTAFVYYIITNVFTNQQFFNVVFTNNFCTQMTSCSKKNCIILCYEEVNFKK